MAVSFVYFVMSYLMSHKEQVCHAASIEHFEHKKKVVFFFFWNISFSRVYVD